MKKNVFLFLFCFILISNCFASTDKILEVYDILNKSAVQLEMCTIEDCSEGYICSGIIIKEDNYSTGILTARHCFEGKNIVKTLINDEYLVVKQELANDIDVAYIEIAQSLLRFNPISIAKYNANEHDYVYYLGYPPEKKMFEIGIVFYNTLKQQIIIMNSIGGCSGSGVVNQNKELIGILWGGDTINWFGQKVDRLAITPIEKIKPFLIKLKIWNQLQ
jgi:hypothetical protein